MLEGYLKSSRGNIGASSRMKGLAANGRLTTTMKFLPSQLAYLLGEREMQRNLGALLKYMGVLGTTVAAFSVLFHLIMLHEGQQHSWLTGFYWTLTVMSTLGFGDITFHSDLGRLFSIVVLLSGIVMLLIVLPFMFIRFFYAPWLEAQVRARAPRAVPDDLRDHVIICRHDAIAIALIPRLEEFSIPYVVVEPDPAVAANLHLDGVSVVTGAPTARVTYEATGAARARLVFANLDDATNTNLTLAVREVAPEVEILGLVDNDDSIDVLELSGVTSVLPLKRELGEHLASRVSVGAPRAHRVARFEDLVIAEFPIEHTTLSGRTIRDTRLRELTGGSSPFTERIREALAAELQAEREAEIGALESEQAARVAEVQAGADRQALDRLTDRLLTLSGFDANRPAKSNGG